MDEVEITAIICTHNRERYLARAVNSLLRQTLPRDKYEVVIVDNNSTDGTASVISRLMAGNSIVRGVFEPRTGLSFARNCGIQNSRGKYVAYLDDDAWAVDDWLETFLELFKGSGKNAGCIGGRIELDWEVPIPRWFPKELSYFLGGLDLGDEILEICGPNWLGGGNCAYLKSALQAAGSFDSRLGRTGKSLLSSEETMVQKNLITAGYTVLYCPHAVINHAVPGERCSQAWFIRRAFWQGISDSVITKMETNKHPSKHFVRILRAIAGMIRHPGQILSLVIPSSGSRIFRLKCEAWKRIGFVWGGVKLLFSRDF